MVKKTTQPNPELEPIDIYGNWKVKDLEFEKPVKPFGVEKGKSKFKIRNKESKHVLIKKRDVGWNGNQTEIALTEIKNSGTDQPLFNNNLRLKAMVTFEGDNYEVSFGSDDDGVSLKFQVIAEDPRKNPGGTGTSGRGG